jgi:O-antigen/teichoic acid export membrane protein
VSFKQFLLNTSAISSVGVLRLLAQFFAVPILSRLLSPADYGVVGMAMPFVLFAMVVADAGIGVSLVRHPAGDHLTWSSCFWMSVLLGIASAMGMVGIAFVAARSLGEPRIAPIVSALAFCVFAQAVLSIPVALLQKRERFKTVAATEIISAIAGVAAAVAVALTGGGAWALVGQLAAFYAVRLSLVFSVAQFQPSLAIDWSRAKEHVIFGRDVLGSNLVGFFTRSLDILVIGKVLGATSAGFYGMAFQFLRLPLMIITGPLQYVLFAQLVEIRRDKETMRGTFLLFTRTLALAIFPTMGLVAAAHGPVFDLLLSPNWRVSGELFFIVAPVAALQSVNSLGGTFVTAAGRIDIRMKTTAEFGVLWLTALLASASFGIVAVAMAYVLVVLTYLPRSLSLTLSVIGCSAREYLSALIAPAIATAGGVVLFESLIHLLMPGELASLFMAATLAILAVAFGGIVQRPHLVRGIKQVFGAIRRYDADTAPQETEAVV